MLSGLKKVSVFDPVTKTVVQLNKVAPDGTFAKEPQGAETASGGFFFGGENAHLECNCFETDSFDQLETWMKQETDVQLVTAGIEDNILWYENSKIKVKKNYGFAVGNRNSFLLSIDRKGGALNIKNLTNLILGNSLWKDSDANGKVDSLVFSGDTGDTYAFSNDEQVITSVTAGHIIYMISTIVYPIAGVNIYSSFVTSLNQNTVNFCNLYSEDSGNDLLDTVGLLGGPDHILTSAGTYYINYRIGITLGTAGFQTKIKVPYGINY